MKKIFILFSLSLFLLANVQAQCILVCNTDVNISLGPNGTAPVVEDMVLEGNSAMNCDVLLSLYSDVNFTNQIIAPTDTMLLTCDHLGTYYYQAEDIASGNTCWGTLLISDMGGFCQTTFPDTYSLTFGGGNYEGPINTAGTLNGNPINQLYNWLWLVPFADVIPGENVIDFPSTTAQSSLNGISTLDIVGAQRMIVLDPIEYPLKAIIADVDDSGYLGVNDLAVMRQYILGIIGEMPAKDFLFFSETYELPSDFDPFDFVGLNFREYRFDKDLVTPEDLKFRVFKIGDLDQVTTITGFQEETVEKRSTQTLLIDKREVVNGENYSIPVRLESNDFDINGLQLSLNLSGLQLNDVSHNYVGTELMFNEAGNNDLRFSFLNSDGASSFEMILEVQALQSGNVENMIDLNNSFDHEVVGYDDRSDIDLRFESISNVNEVQTLETKVTGNEVIVQLKEGHTAPVQLFDVQGRLIYTAMPAANQVIIDKVNIPNAGMYFISTESEGKLVSKRVVVML